VPSACDIFNDQWSRKTEKLHTTTSFFVKWYAGGESSFDIGHGDYT
jgi:hypothetical protein